MYFDGIYIFIQNQELKRFGCLYSLYIISSWYILKVTAATFVKNWNNLSRIDIFNKSFFAIVTGNQETQRLSSEKLLVFINKLGRPDNGLVEYSVRENILTNCYGKALIWWVNI